MTGVGICERGHPLSLVLCIYWRISSSFAALTLDTVTVTMVVPRRTDNKTRPGPSLETPWKPCLLSQRMLWITKA